MAETGIPSIQLMEQAAAGLCQAMHRYPGSRALFLCGPGNNGGDGYAAARLWQRDGGEAVIWELTSPTEGAAGENRALALGLGIPFTTVTDLPDALPDADIIVDALFGTGLSRPISGIALQLVHLMNRAGCPVIAADIPSGLSGANGMVLGDAVRAAETVTFHRIKSGLILGQSAEYTGRITVSPIGIPADYGHADGLFTADPDDLAALCPPRPANGHKGTFGKAVIFAGNMGMCGAAAFAARACVTSGAGLTYLLCRASLIPILQVLAPEAVCIPLPEQDGILTPEATDTARHALEGADACLVGCGLGESDDLLPVLDVIRRAACPVIWDASALNLLAAHPALLPLPAAHIITPHPGEAGRLLDIPIRDITGDMPAAATVLHQRTGCSVLLKGARTVMTDGSAMAANRFGSPAMGKGGSGDVLAGILCALSARRDHHLTPLETMQAGALIHGLAGIRAAAQYGEHCVTPARLIDAIRLDADLLPDI